MNSLMNSSHKLLKENVFVKKQRMILLQQNNTNNVFLTLSDSVTLTATPIYYLFRFIDTTTNNEKLFTAADISTNTIRYNQFVLTLTSSTAYENLSAGTICLAPEGKWEYEVYQQLYQYNLSLTGVVGDPIEYGYIKLSGTPNTIINSYYSGSTTTYTYYQP